MGSSSDRVLNMLVLTLVAIYFLGISEVSGHAPGNTGTFLYWFDAYLASTSDKCGQQKPISGWTVTSQRCDANGDTSRPCPAADPFQAGSGIFTTPAQGVYHCCAQFRCKQGGYCDYTVIRNGARVYQAFGTRNTGVNQNGWSSHSACWTTNAQAGVTLWLNLESTAGTDCIEETGWRYNRFTCYYASPNT